MSSKIKRERVKTMPGRDGRVGFEGEHVIEGKFNVGKEIRPAVGGKRHVTGS